MERLVRKHLRTSLKKGKKREYYEKEYFIYTTDEAEDAKISFAPWYEAEEGDYGVSSDGFVAV